MDRDAQDRTDFCGTRVASPVERPASIRASWRAQGRARARGIPSVVGSGGGRSRGRPGYPFSQRVRDRRRPALALFHLHTGMDAAGARSAEQAYGTVVMGPLSYTRRRMTRADAREKEMNRQAAVLSRERSTS